MIKKTNDMYLCEFIKKETFILIEKHIYLLDNSVGFVRKSWVL